MELSIDTATNVAGVALSNRGDTVSAMTWHTHHNHTLELIPKVIELLDQCGAGLDRLEAIIATHGPGSFNGIRVGLATAKGLAFSLNIPLVTVSTLEAAAFAHHENDLPICPIIGAGRKEIATALFQNQDGNWRRVTPEHITRVEDMYPKIAAETLFCGEITEEIEQRIAQALGSFAIFQDRASAPERISCLPQLGWRRIEEGRFDDLGTVQPFYLKRPSITTPKTRRNDAMSSMRPGS